MVFSMGLSKHMYLDFMGEEWMFEQVHDWSGYSEPSGCRGMSSV